MNRVYFKVEDDVVVKYKIGEDTYTTEVVMTKEIFQECYRKWIEPQEGEE